MRRVHTAYTGTMSLTRKYVIIIVTGKSYFLFGGKVDIMRENMVSAQLIYTRVKVTCPTIVYRVYYIVDDDDKSWVKKV